MIRGIHHVAINTANFERIFTFYTKVLGFSPAIENFSFANDPLIDAVIGLKNAVGRQTILNAGNCYIELFEYSQPAARDSAPLRPCDRGYTHFCLDVTDIEAEYDRLAEAGMVFMHDRPGDFGDIKAVYGQDPDGNIIEIQQTTREQVFSLAQLGTVNFA